MLANGIVYSILEVTVSDFAIGAFFTIVATFFVHCPKDLTLVILTIYYSYERDVLRHLLK